MCGTAQACRAQEKFDLYAFLLQEAQHQNRVNQMFSEPYDGLRSLEYIYVQRNQLRTLPTSVGMLTALVVLKADHNHLIDLPENFGDLRQLREISAGFNRIAAIPVSLGRCTSLQRLALHSNRISEVRVPLYETSYRTSVHQICRKTRNRQGRAVFCAGYRTGFL